MADTPRVHISPEILLWLVDRSGKDPDDFVDKYPKWEAWLSGDTGPTLGQAQQLAKTAGVPLRFDYEINTSEFTFEWAIPGSASASSAGGPSVRTPPLQDMPPLTSNKTEIFYPSLLAHGRKVVVRGLDKEDRWAYDETRQTLTIVTANNAPGTVHRATVGVDPLPKEAFEVNDFWGDFGGQILAWSLVIVTVAVLLFSWLLG